MSGASLTNLALCRDLQMGRCLCQEDTQKEGDSFDKRV
jgi:hypothetical protein